MMSLDAISWWWTMLCAIGALNIVLWSASALALNRRHRLMSEEGYRARRLQLLLSGVYVAGCAFRSVFPVFDVPRICLFNTWLSSVLLGRSVATIAELCFVAQWALMLHETSRASGSVVGKIGSVAVVPLIVIAESCSWYSVLSTSNLGHIAEESIWGLSAALFVAGLVSIWPHCHVARRRVILACCVAGVAYVAFMALVDVPMYWSRWIADEASGRHYLSIAQGIRDVAARRVVSYHWSDWKNEIPWMSLYFSVAVWLSISLIHTPAPEALLPGVKRKRLKSVVALGMATPD
jgi:hypothetical protein